MAGSFIFKATEKYCGVLLILVSKQASMLG